MSMINVSKLTILHILIYGFSIANIYCIFYYIYCVLYDTLFIGYTNINGYYCLDVVFDVCMCALIYVCVCVR